MAAFSMTTIQYKLLLSLLAFYTGRQKSYFFNKI